MNASTVLLGIEDSGMFNFLALSTASLLSIFPSDRHGLLHDLSNAKQEGLQSDATIEYLSHTRLYKFGLISLHPLIQ